VIIIFFKIFYQLNTLTGCDDDEENTVFFISKSDASKISSHCLVKNKFVEIYTTITASAATIIIIIIITTTDMCVYFQ